MDTEQWLDELDAAEGAPSALSDAPQNAASAEAPVPVLEPWKVSYGFCIPKRNL